MSAVCDCCVITIALKDMIEAVTLSNLLSVGYLGLGCHDPTQQQQESNCARG